MMTLGIPFGLALASPLWIQNRKVLVRISQYAYCRWYHEGVSTDLSRRESGFSMTEQNLHDRLKASLEMTTAIIDLVTKGDWKGFDRKIRNIDDLIGLPEPEILTWNNVNEYFKLLQ